MGSMTEKYDVVIVGGGFGGTYALHELRGLGFSTHLFEAGAALGGIWYWNSYPGARVDTESPVYQLTDPALYTDWNWTERYPGRDELVAYFDHVADIWDLKRDITFNARVQAASWNKISGQWDLSITKTSPNGTEQVQSHANSVIFCTGFASKHHTPPFAGMENYEGIMSHTALWTPGTDYNGKRVAVVGTGASGVQVVQAVAPDVKQLTLFQRTPNFALPMGQKQITKERNDEYRHQYPVLTKKMKTTYAGFLYDFDPRKTTEVSVEERNRLYEELYNKGGVYFWLGTFSDVLKDNRANDTAYEFWRQKTIQRIDDPKTAELLAPKIAPHPYGTKRVSLEQNYFETFNRDNVSLVDLIFNPIDTFTKNGIKTKDGVEHEFDVIILATGFDSVTGGLTQIDIRGTDGTSIKEKWSGGVRTHLGMTTAGFPNLFMVYGPQAPTAFATGPMCAETQGGWIAKALLYLRDGRLNSMEPTTKAEEAWREHVVDSAQEGLFSQAKSWYFGDNIPGKPREALNYMAGMQLYKQKCQESTENGYQDFILA
jgi:cation diffusion facilitator CzcD-associated flavoprotein CzcO